MAIAKPIDIKKIPILFMNKFPVYLFMSGYNWESNVSSQNTNYFEYDCALEIFNHLYASMSTGISYGM